MAALTSSLTLSHPDTTSELSSPPMTFPPATTFTINFSLEVAARLSKVRAKKKVANHQNQRWAPAIIIESCSI